MLTQLQTQEHTHGMPLQMKAEDTAQTEKKSKRGNPYEGAPLQVSGKLANHIKQSFGINANELAIRESSEVADMGARATAQGNAIRFAPGEFRPDTREGMEVLGHELNHVREQATGGVHASAGEVFEHPGHEAASDKAGEAFASGGLSAAAPVSVGGMSAGAAPVQGLFGGGKKKQAAPVRRQIPSAPEGGGTWRDMFEPMGSELGRISMEKGREGMTFDQTKKKGLELGSRSYNEGGVDGALGAYEGIFNQILKHVIVNKMAGAETEDERRTAMSFAGRQTNEATNVDSAATNEIFKNFNADAIKMLREKYKKKKGNISTSEKIQMTGEVIDSLSSEIQGNEEARKYMQGSSGILTSVPGAEGYKSEADQTTISNLMLRSVSSALFKAISAAPGKNLTESQQKEQQFLIGISKILQFPANALLSDDEAYRKTLVTKTSGNLDLDLSSEENLDMMSTLRSKMTHLETDMNLPVGAPSASEPAPAPVPERDGPAYGPLTQSQQATMDKWDSGAQAPAKKKPWYKRLFGR